jgi:hypothetical protein
MLFEMLLSPLLRAIALELLLRNTALSLSHREWLVFWLECETNK